MISPDSTDTIKVLDHGYVRMLGSLGSDIDVVNAARVSYDKEVQEFSDKDISLLSFLIKHKHDSTLRHCAIAFEIYAPLMVARQWYKHTVASSHIDDQLGWNESSRRYITEEPTFYIPEQWRLAPENKKQGSAGFAGPEMSRKITERLQWHIKESEGLYHHMMSLGIAPEQARLFLPAYSLYVRWRWTASLNALLHFLSLRNADDAQSEIRDYASAVGTFVNTLYPETMKAWEEYRG
jgi:thymidylate synthase (FAD)